MSDREERLALNEVAFRDVNERVAARVEEVAGTHATFNVLCECSKTDCALRISITPAEYESIHADATQFIVVAGHASPGIEDIVGGTAGYHTSSVSGAMQPKSLGRGTSPDLTPTRRSVVTA
jgi:hypothetical protein